MQQFSHASYAPFEQLGTELHGPFPWSSIGHRWIVVCIDSLTVYWEMATIFTATATVPSLCIQFSVTDHSSHNQQLSKSVCCARGRAATMLTHLCLSIFYALLPANGLTEHTNPTFISMLAMCIASHHKNWDEILPFRM